jgi:RHS repeat-associated protein
VPQVSGALTLGVAYNSLLTEKGFPVGSGGNGWRQRLGGDVRVYQAPGGDMVFFGPDGACGTFKRDGSGYTSPPTFHAFLDKHGSGWKMTWYDTGATWEFNDHGRLASITDRNKNTTAIEYDAGGFQTRLTVKPNGAKDPVRTVDASWTGIYLTKLTWAGGSTGTRHVSYEVSSSTGNLEQVTQPDGTVVKFGYNASNDLTSITNGKDVTTTIGYDSRHRVTSVSQPLQDGTHAVTRFTYPSDTRTLMAGPATGQSQPVPGVPHVTYDVDKTIALVTRVTDQQGYTWSTEYTPFGDIATTRNPLGAVTAAGYGANEGRSLTRVEYPAGFSASLGYGNSPTPENPTAAYQPSTSTDTLGNSTAFTYGGPGNLTEATSALPAKAKVKYNSDGTPSSSTDPGNGDNDTIYHYNGDHQLEKITPVKDSSLRERTFTYDGYGRLRTATDGAGNTVTYTYDDAGRVLEAAHAGTHPVTVTYKYDKAGNLTIRTDPNGTTTWDYDQRNKPVSRTSTHGGGTQSYSWGRCGNLASVSDDAGTTRYAYDTRGQLAALTDPGGSQWAFSYDANGNRTQTLFGITPASWGGQIITRYDAAGRITRIQASRRTSAGQVTVTDSSYSYVSGGRETGLVHSATNNITGISLVHTYDKGRRLIKSTNVIDGKTYEYDYDTNGNLTTFDAGGDKTTWKHNPASQITGNGDYSYDGAGNQTSGPAAGTLRYNAAGQMASATRHDSTEETFTYAGDTQTELLSTGTATGITYGITGLRAYTPAGSSTTAYIVRDQSGSLLGLVHDGVCYGYVTDHLGNISAIIGPGGDDHAGYVYDPYGNLVHSSGPLASTNLLRYLGALNDPADGTKGTGWTHLGYRWLNHSDGRYTQQDTIIRLANPQNANRYAYAADNPVNYTDPTGQSWWDPSWLQSALRDIESWVDSWNWGCAAAVLSAAGLAVALVGISVTTAGTADIFYGGYLIAVAGNAGEQLTFTGIGLGFLGSLAGDFAAC